MHDTASGSAAPAPLLVSLVVPLRNEEQSLPELVDSIRAQTRPPDEIILVDGGSTDATVALAQQLTDGDPRFRVLEAGEATPGRGRNVGIAEASHDWIALTDAGIRLEPTWLCRLLEVLRQNPLLRVVYGNHEPITRSLFERCAALVYTGVKRRRSGQWLRGPSVASALIHRDVWRAVGGFPDLRAAEDGIFIERVERHGCQIGWAPTATVWHYLQPSLRSTWRKFLLYSKWNVWAGRQRYWHYGLARTYALALVLVLLAVFHSPWWLAVLGLGTAARVAKCIWLRRDGRGILWLLNPLQFAGVGAVLLAIDAATFAGWFSAAWRHRPPSAAHRRPRPHTEGARRVGRAERDPRETGQRQA